MGEISRSSIFRDKVKRDAMKKEYRELSVLESSVMIPEERRNQIEKKAEDEREATGESLLEASIRRTTNER